MQKTSLTPYLNTLLFTASQMVLLGLIPYFSQIARLPESEVVAAFSFGSFLFLFSGPFWGYLSDRYSRQLIISLGMLGLFCSNLLLTLELHHDFASLQIWFSRIVYGFFAAAIVPVTQALVMEKHLTAEKFQPLLKNSLSLNLGRFVGPFGLLVFTLFSQNIGIFLKIFTATCLFLFLSQLTHLKEPSVRSKNLGLKFSDLIIDFVNLPKLPMLIALLFSIFIGTVNTSLAGLLKDQLQLSSETAAQWMSFVLLGTSLIAIGVQLLLKKYLKSVKSSLMITATLLLVAGSYLLFHLTPLSLIGVVILLGAGLCILPPCYLTLLTKNQKRLGGSTSFVGIVSTLGYAIGGFILSFFLKHEYSIANLIFACSLSLCLAVVIFAVLSPKPKASL